MAPPIETGARAAFAIYSTVPDCRKEGLDREVRQLLGRGFDAGHSMGDAEIGLRQG